MSGRPPSSASRVWKFGDGVNTDDMLPGKYAPLMVGADRFQEYAFAHLRPEFASEVRPGDLLVGGWNWGLGSSREYAPRALKKLGVGGVIAKSFARIHFRNLINLGIPAVAAPTLVDLFEDGDRAALDAVAGWVELDGDRYDLPALGDFVAEILEAGSLMEHFRRHRRFPGE